MGQRCEEWVGAQGSDERLYSLRTTKELNSSPGLDYVDLIDGEKSWASELLQNEVVFTWVFAYSLFAQVMRRREVYFEN